MLNMSLDNSFNGIESQNYSDSNRSSDETEQSEKTGDEHKNNTKNSSELTPITAGNIQNLVIDPQNNLFFICILNNTNSYRCIQIQ